MGQKIRVFRKREKREVVVLSEGNVKFSGEGQISSARVENNQENNWTSRLLFDSEGVIGTPIYPTGRARAQDLDWGNQIYQKGRSNSEWPQSKK